MHYSTDTEYFPLPSITAKLSLIVEWIPAAMWSSLLHRILPNQHDNDTISRLRNTKPFRSFWPQTRSNFINILFLPYYLDKYTQTLLLSGHVDILVMSVYCILFYILYNPAFLCCKINKPLHLTIHSLTITSTCSGKSICWMPHTQLFQF